MTLVAKLSGVLIAVAIVSCNQCFAQGVTQFDLSDQINTQRASQGPTDYQYSSGAQGDRGRGTGRTGPGARWDAPDNRDYSDYTATQSPISRGELEQARTAVLAPDSVDNSPIPSGQFKFGFKPHGPQVYRGTTAYRAMANGSRPPSFGVMLPPTATTSVDIEICDLPFTRSKLGFPNPWSPPGAVGTAGPPVDNIWGMINGSTPPPGYDPGSTPPGNTPGPTNPGNGYVSNAPSYRYTADGGYMTGSGIIVYPNGRKVTGGPMFMYKSGYGFADISGRNGPAVWSYDRSAPYRAYN